MKLRLLRIAALGTIPVIASLSARDTILEFKTAYFLPTTSHDKNSYDGGVIFGPELTVQLLECRNWYAFASVDYFCKSENDLSVHLVPLGIGLKYFMPLPCNCMNFYAGLGFQPVYVCEKRTLSAAVQEKSKWKFGGIAKVGSYIDLAYDVLLDIFIDYSFIASSSDKDYSSYLPLRAKASGALFGGGLCYRF